MDWGFNIMSLPHKRVYLMNPSKEVVIRSVPGKMNSRFYAKKRGGEEYELPHLSILLHDTLKSSKRITRGQYIEF